ncbi:alpha/beta hydrolase fold domain-containing protein [Halobacillus salinarum]|uniref:Alpha/beta hydrolase fold domain-containing protein n=1 Tax=Halobacillus salinarum TaxID=2932257 RepID=A0ABY4EPZ2_9BACI|nr:alpha/beta hydrolase [Halobacillus salinarum]UOQ45987.1 alpha/beta hydrolase fold domain-containing protein [Halobacillus salinarum]
MPVNPLIQLMLHKMKENPMPPLSEVTPEEYRERERKIMSVPQPEEKVQAVDDCQLELDGRAIQIRVYTPLGGNKPYPCLVYYHGGGWVLGSLDTHDIVCKFFASECNCKVISVDYRLAPENKFPAAVRDAYESFEKIYEDAEHYGIRRDSMAVGGDSAGGNLAAVTAIWAKENSGPPIRHQLLIYPSTGFKEESDSLIENAQGFLLTTEMMHWFREHYFYDTEDLNHPHASPIFYEDKTGLPPATILTAQYDPLRDAGKAYADELREAGVKVNYQNFEGLIHGFANFIGLVPEAKRALSQAAVFLNHSFQEG